MIDRARIIDGLRHEGFEVIEWTDDAGTHYAEHAHTSEEVLVVLSGEITFSLLGTEHRLGPGERLALAAGATHTATVGPNGATYLVAARR